MIAKTEKEKEVLREGGRRMGRYLRELSKMVIPGASAYDVEMKARALVRADGDETVLLGYTYDPRRPAFPSAICLSVNECMVHSPASENGAVFAEGDIVKLDFVVRHGGFCMDSAVTVIAGRPKSSEDERLVRAAHEALAAGIAEAKAGNTTGDIGYAVERIARREKLGYPRNLSGHGIGTKIHEPPNVPNYGKPGEGDKLVEGQIITVEPMFSLGTGELYIGTDGHGYCTRDRSRTAHVEHTIMIGKDGAEILTEE
jgi:methionyl aminopeptidase